MAAVPTEVRPAQHRSLVATMASRYGVDAEKLLPTLKATCFRLESGEVTNEQMMALLVIANEYKLNPFTREIYAFPDKSKGVVPIVSIDGWARIINERPELDGIEFVDAPTTAKHDSKDVPEWIECVIYRKDRAHPVRVRERFAECRRGTGPWGSHPSRMLRHKALIQCARVAFGFAGIYDEDEARQIIERDVTPVGEQPRAAETRPQQTRTSAAVDKVKARRAAQTIDGQAERQEATADAAPQAETKEPSPAITDESVAMLKLDSCETREQALELLDLVRGQAFETTILAAVDAKFPGE